MAGVVGDGYSPRTHDRPGGFRFHLGRTDHVVGLQLHGDGRRHVAVARSDGRPIVAKVTRVFQKQQISPWNFAIFYVDPLEIHPGPTFVVTGWVHTNSDLFTGHSSLTFADKVTYGEDWTIGFMPGDGEHPETPASPHYPSDFPPARDQALQPFGLDANSLFNPSDLNNNNDSYRELIEPPTALARSTVGPSVTGTRPTVVIQVDASNNVTIGRPNANGTVTAFSSIPSTDPNYAKYQALLSAFSTAGAITTNQSIQDDREGGSIRLVTLDISKILDPLRLAD